LLYLLHAPMVIGGNKTCITDPPAIDQYSMCLPKGGLLNREVWTNPPGADLSPQLLFLHLYQKLLHLCLSIGMYAS